jgi:hypothetical protein
MALQTAHATSTVSALSYACKSDFFSGSKNLSVVHVPSSKRPVCKLQAIRSENAVNEKEESARHVKSSMSSTRRVAMVGYMAALAIGQMAGPSHVAPARANANDQLETAKGAIENVQKVGNVVSAAQDVSAEYNNRVASASKDAEGAATSVFEKVVDSLQEGANAITSAVEEGADSVKSAVSQ